MTASVTSPVAATGALSLIIFLPVLIREQRLSSLSN